MTPTIIASVMALTEMVPQIYKWFKNPEDKAIPSHMIAQKVVEIAKKVANKSDPSQAVNALQNNPKSLIEFQQAVAKLDQELEVAYLKDRSDARAKAVAMLDAGRTSKRGDLMAVAAGISLMICVFILIFFAEKLSGEVICIITTVIGIFGLCLKDVHAFEFGSSRDSKNKDLTSFIKDIM